MPSRSMDVYRTPPRLEHWSAECSVRGPMGPFTTASLMLARDENHAVDKFKEWLVEQGFETLSDVTARRV